MNMPVALADAAPVDARGSRGAKTGGSAGANDDGTTSFDGVLSDVGTDEATSKPATTDAPTDAPTATTDPSQLTNDSMSLEVLMGFVSQAQTSPASAAMAAARGAKSSDKTSSADESVDALLKRIAKKEEDAKDSADQPTAATTSDSDPRLGALAALVAQITPLGTAQTGNGQAPGTKAGADRAASATQQEPAADTTPVTAKDTIVSDIAVETHLALSPASTDGRSRTTSAVGPARSGGTTDDASKTLGSTIDPDATTVGKSAATNSEHRGGTQDDSNGKGQQDIPKAESAKTEGITSATPMLASDLGSLRRIASAVVELATAPGVSNASVPDADTQPKTTAPARTLILQMQPANLGTVDVRLHMSSNGLDLQLGISDEHTLGMVSRERDTLTSMLQDQNYQVHSLVIQESGGGASSTSSGSGGNQNPSPQSEARADRQYGASNSNDQGASQRQQQGDRPAQNGRQPRETPSLRTPADPGNSLFV